MSINQVSTIVELRSRIRELTRELEEYKAIVHDLREDREIHQIYEVAIWSTSHHSWETQGIFHTRSEAIRYLEKLYEDNENYESTIYIWVQDEIIKALQYKDKSFFLARKE